MEILFWIAVLTWMAKRGAEDLVHAVKGTPNPRYELKKAKAAKAGQPAPQQPRYGGKEWFADLLSDAMAANTAKRRKAAAAKAQPVDDMVDLVQESRPVPERRVYDPNDTRNCPVCKGEVVLDGRPCPACLARQRQRNAEWEAEHGEPEWLTPDRDEVDEPTSVVHDDRHPYCVSPCGPLCTLGAEYDDVAAGRLLGRDLAADQPTARIYQFPNIQHIEKEIDMSNPEATGLSTAIAFAEAAAQAHASFSTAGSEGYAGALERMGFGDGITALAAEAREQSTVAADKWKALADAMENFQTGREFYASNPDAPDKVALVNE